MEWGKKSSRVKIGLRKKPPVDFAFQLPREGRIGEVHRTVRGATARGWPSRGLSPVLSRSSSFYSFVTPYSRGCILLSLPSRRAPQNTHTQTDERNRTPRSPFVWRKVYPLSLDKSVNFSQILGKHPVLNGTQRDSGYSYLKWLKWCCNGIRKRWNDVVMEGRLVDASRLGPAKSRSIFTQCPLFAFDRLFVCR